MGQDIYLKLRKKDSPKDEYGNDIDTIPEEVIKALLPAT